MALPPEFPPILIVMLPVPSSFSPVQGLKQEAINKPQTIKIGKRVFIVIFIFLSYNWD